MGDERPRFEWDRANRDHIARHGGRPEEAEQAILDPHAILLEIETSRGEERTKAVGITASGRLLVVVFALRVGAIRPITAYDAGTRLEALYFAYRDL